MSELSGKMGDSPEQRRLDLLNELREKFPNASSAELIDLANSRERAMAKHGGVAPELEDEAGDMSTSDGLGSGGPESGPLGEDHDSTPSMPGPRRYGVNLSRPELRVVERAIQMAIEKDEADGPGADQYLISSHGIVKEILEHADSEFRSEAG